MDIDDILASVTAAHPSGPGGSFSGAPSPAADLRALTRAWANERCAPELLPWPAALVARVSARLRAQIAAVEERTGRADPGGGFALVVVQTELERVKFLVRSLLRARLAKIDRHTLHYLSAAGGAAGRLSDPERAYARARHALLAGHYAASFLGQFPAQLRRLDDAAGGAAMVEAPEVDGAVFVRCVRDAGRVALDGGGGADGAGGGGGEVELKRGDVYVIRWRAVRDKVEAGDVELL